MKPLRRRDLTFALAREEDLAGILAFCQDNLYGAEVYASVKLCGADTDIGSLWTGRDTTRAWLIFSGVTLALTCVY